MKVYRELTVSGPRDAILSMVDEIERNLNDGWERDTETEEKGRRRAFLKPDEMRFCFRCAPTSARKGALLVLMSHPASSENGLWLSNIVPDEMRQLTHDEFNYILEEFLHKFARPAVAKTGAKIETSTGVVGLEDWFTRETADKLRRFLSFTHGRTTGNPADYDEWMTFLAAARRDGARIDEELLRRWLEEEGGCEDYVAADLASQFQFAQDLMKAYVGA